MGKITKKNQVPDFLFHLAQGFYDVGLHLAIQVKKDNSVKGFQRIAPAVVNFTFAAELMLKGLHLITTKMEIKSHKLWDLYRLLSPDIKLQIEAAYIEFQKQKSDNLPAFRINVTQDKETKRNYESKDNLVIKELLLIHNNSFEDWRYLHEIQIGGYNYEYNFILMEAFIKSLIEVINATKSKNRPSMIIGKVK